MLNVEQLKRSVNRMELDDIRQAVDELQMDGLVTDGKTPFTRVHFNTCFAEIERCSSAPASTGRSMWSATRARSMRCTTPLAGRPWRCCAG